MSRPSLTAWLELQRVAWRRVLREAEEKGDDRRAAYARWILREVLRDDDPQALHPR